MDRWMLRREFRQLNLEALATKKASFFGPFANLVVFKEFHGLSRVLDTELSLPSV